MLRRAWAWIEKHPRPNAAYRIGAGTVGGVLAVNGLRRGPLPGPGW